MRLIACALGLALFCLPSPRARAATAPVDAALAHGGDAPPIVAIEVEGLRRVDAAAATAGGRLRPGSPCEPAHVTRDLHAMWATGFFKDIQVYAERTGTGAGAGVGLVFVVDEKPSIRRILFEGRDALGEDDIKGAVDIKPFTILNVESLRRNVGKLRELYLPKGFYLAQVEHAVVPVPGSEHEVDIRFRFVEGEKVTVRQVSFIGNHALSDDVLRGVMQTRPGHELSWLMQSGTYKEDIVQADVFRLQGLYYDQGFVAVKIGTPQATISRDRRHIYLSIPIEEGDRFHVGEIEFTGDVELPASGEGAAVSAATLRPKLTISPNETFNRSQLFADMQALTDVYRDRGFAYANVTPNSRVDPARRAVDLQMEVDRGELVTLERIEVVGNSRTRDKVIRRELRIGEGERFSQGAINLSRARVYQLGFFESVNINTQVGSRPDTMRVDRHGANLAKQFFGPRPIVVSVDAAELRRLCSAAGYFSIL